MNKLSAMELILRFLPLADRLDQAVEAGEGIVLTNAELIDLTDFVDVVMKSVGQSK